MYLHIGQNIVVPESDVVGIFDLDNTSWSHITRKFLKGAENSGRVHAATDDLPKSFVLCDSGAGIEVHLSQLSSATLLKRSETMRFD